MAGIDQHEQFDPGQQAPYEAILHRYRAGIDTWLSSDRAAVDIGVGALKTVILLNGGSLIGLLAFLGQHWDNADRALSLAVVHASHGFVWGVGLGALSFLIAYIYQSCVTALAQHSLEQLSTGADPKTGAAAMRWTCGITAIAMISLTVISLTMFACGAVSVMKAFESS